MRTPLTILSLVMISSTVFAGNSLSNFKAPLVWDASLGDYTVSISLRQPKFNNLPLYPNQGTASLFCRELGMKLVTFETKPSAGTSLFGWSSVGDSERVGTFSPDILEIEHIVCGK